MNVSNMKQRRIIIFLATLASLRGTFWANVERKAGGLNGGGAADRRLVPGRDAHMACGCAQRAGRQRRAALYLLRHVCAACLRHVSFFFAASVWNIAPGLS